MEIIVFLKEKLMALPNWSSQTLYLACQLNTMHVIATLMEQKEGRVIIGSNLHIRVLLECVVNSIAGCQEPIYAQKELEKLATKRANRKMKPKQLRKIRCAYEPETWHYATEARAQWNRGNCIVHGDADTSFYLRADPLHAIDVKAFALAVVSLTEGTQVYLNQIGAFFTDQQQADGHFNRLKAALANVVAEGQASFKEISPYEDRLYLELNKYNAKLDYTNLEAQGSKPTP